MPRSVTVIVVLSYSQGRGNCLTGNFSASRLTGSSSVIVSKTLPQISITENQSRASHRRGSVLDRLHDATPRTRRPESLPYGTRLARGRANRRVSHPLVVQSVLGSLVSAERHCRERWLASTKLIMRIHAVVPRKPVKLLFEMPVSDDSFRERELRRDVWSKRPLLKNRPLVCDTAKYRLHAVSFSHFFAASNSALSAGRTASQRFCSFGTAFVNCLIFRSRIASSF